MESIKQKIQRERGEYGRQRRKKFEYFKHLGRLDLYYKQKRIPMMPRLRSAIQGLKWWQRIYIFLVIGYRRLWRKLFGAIKE